MKLTRNEEIGIVYATECGIWKSPKSFLALVGGDADGIRVEACQPERKPAVFVTPDGSVCDFIHVSSETRARLRRLREGVVKCAHWI